MQAWLLLIISDCLTGRLIPHLPEEVDPILYKIIVKVLFTPLDPSPCDSTCMNNVAIDPGRKCSLGEFGCNSTV